MINESAQRGRGSFDCSEAAFRVFTLREIADPSSELGREEKKKFASPRKQEIKSNFLG